MSWNGNTTDSSIFQLSVIKAYSLVLFALAVAMFSRALTDAGAPGLFNFIHFALVPLVFGLLYPSIRPRFGGLLVGFWALLIMISLSALINDAGLINVVLDFLLLAEPFLLLGAMICVPWSRSSINRFRYWLLLFIVVHVLLAYYQRFALGLTGDDVVGLFLGQPGAHKAGAVALVAGIYFGARLTDLPMILRAALTLAFSAVVVFADAKQVITTCLMSVFMLSLIKWRQPGHTFRYIALLGAAIGITVWLAGTVFPELAGWAESEKIRRGIEQKLTVFPILASFYESPLNLLFGLGPGHTVGRLGLLLPDYYQYFEPLGATISPVTQTIWLASEASTVSNSVTGSSMWALTFSWAGIWGDLGLLGLGTYFCLWWLVWRRLCSTDLSRFFLIVILVFGATFVWLEEPQFMLFIASLIGLEWQEHHSKVRLVSNRRSAKHLVKGPYADEVTAPYSEDY